jgi:hypothetical protein
MENQFQRYSACLLQISGGAWNSDTIIKIAIPLHGLVNGKKIEIEVLSQVGTAYQRKTELVAAASFGSDIHRRRCFSPSTMSKAGSWFRA